MNIKTLALYSFIILGVIVLWLLNRQRLQDYNDCYMAKYQDWGTDCVLGGDY